MRLAITFRTTFFSCIIILAGHASANGSELLTMDDAVQAALAANPEIAAAAHEYDAKRARPPQAATPPDPSFMVDFIGVPSNTADVSKGTVQYMVEQDVPFPSKLVYGYKSEKHSAEASLARKSAQAQEVVKQVKVAYLDLWRLDEEARIERETLSIYNQNKGSSDEAYANLKGPVSDPVRASVDMGEVEGRLAIIEQERIDALASLAKLMAAEIGPSTRLAEPPLSAPVPELSGLIEQSKGMRPELAEAKNMAESEKAKLSLAKSQYAPDFTLRWGYMDNPPGLPNAWYGRAGISLPLWSLSKQRYGVRESKAMLARAHSMEETAALNAESQIKSAHARLVAAKRTAEVYGQKVVPRARTLLSSSREAYKSGKGDFLSIVDSIRSLNNARLMLVRARVDMAKAEADLERAVGTGIGGDER